MAIRVSVVVRSGDVEVEHAASSRAADEAGELELLPVGLDLERVGVVAEHGAGVPVDEHAADLGVDVVGETLPCLGQMRRSQIELVPVSIADRIQQFAVLPVEGVPVGIVVVEKPEVAEEVVSAIDVGGQEEIGLVLQKSA